MKGGSGEGVKVAEVGKKRLYRVPCSSTPAQYKGILLRSEGSEPPGQKPCLCIATWPWGLKIKDEQPKYKASRHSCQAAISRTEDCSVMNALAHVGWLVYTIPYSFSQFIYPEVDKLREGNNSLPHLFPFLPLQSSSFYGHASIHRAYKHCKTKVYNFCYG